MGRINRAIELLEADQPIYVEQHYVIPKYHSYQAGVKAAHTWADYINVDMEVGAYDINRLTEFMQGLVDGGPTKSGHRTPAVIVTLPIAGINEGVIQANAWMVCQVLNTGVHGIILCHAESPGAIRAFVETVRYPFHRIGVGDGLGDGRNGHKGEQQAAAIWGLSVDEYLQRADVWPLNPQGEIMLGLKLENKRALANVEANTKVPGIAIAEWGPLDMSWSLGYLGGHVPPYAPEMVQVRSRVLKACKANKIAFLDAVWPDNVIERISEGVMVCAGPPEAAEIGRRHTNRTLPW